VQQGEDVRFSVEIRRRLSGDHYLPSGDLGVRLRLFEVGFKSSDKTRQSTIPDDTAELLFGNDQPGTDPTLDLIARAPALHVSADDPDYRKR